MPKLNCCGVEYDKKQAKTKADKKPAFVRCFFALFPHSPFYPNYTLTIDCKTVDSMRKRDYKKTGNLTQKEEKQLQQKSKKNE
ncbi:MAG: hypothetical protein E7031_02080 [Akkermansiaceae bacterium]|nr:hypothetical protein [Akkermansiaceae bacterium]